MKRGKEEKGKSRCEKEGRGEVSYKSRSSNERSADVEKGTRTNLVVVEMAVKLPFLFVR